MKGKLLISVICGHSLGQIALNNENEEIESIGDRNETHNDLQARGRYYGDDYENFRACVYDNELRLCCSDNPDQVAGWRGQNAEEGIQNS